MLEIIIVCVAALTASILTLFSGFGLGTLLMPVVALFFPIEVAIGVTAIVHLANNLLKLALFGKQANWRVLLLFGLPAMLAALLGAWWLSILAEQIQPLHFNWMDIPITTTWLKVIIGGVILVFTLLEVIPYFARMTFSSRLLPLGGILSGFFGGLSGHQGALRSMFLIKAGLKKESFIATGVVIAVAVDVVRLAVYGVHFPNQLDTHYWPLVLSATLAAFVGVFVGSRLLQKVTIHAIQYAISSLLILIAIGMITGRL